MAPSFITSVSKLLPHIPTKTELYRTFFKRVKGFLQSLVVLNAPLGPIWTKERRETKRIFHFVRGYRGILVLDGLGRRWEVMVLRGIEETENRA